MSFLGEIKRRKVFQVAAVYAVVAWLIVQIVATIEGPLSLPDSFDTAVIVALAIGFPIAVVLAWAFDLTPDGVVRAEEGVSAQRGGRRIEYALFGLLVVAVGWIGFRELNPPVADIEDSLSVNQIGPSSKILLHIVKMSPLSFIGDIIPDL
jgi:hypothetical protein